jgi:hypothetical protein
VVSEVERRVPHVREVAIVGEFAVIGGASAWLLHCLLIRYPGGGLERLLLRSALPPERRRDVLRASRALAEVGAAWRLEHALAGSSSGTPSATDRAGDLPSKREQDRRVELEREDEAAFAFPARALSASDTARVLGLSSRRVRVLAETRSLRGYRDSGGRWWFAADVVEVERKRRMKEGARSRGVR